MPNTFDLSSIAEVIYAAKTTVCAEPTGYIQSVTVNTSEDGASINGVVTSVRPQSVTVNTSATPSMAIPAADDVGAPITDTMTIQQVANVRIPLNGEAMRKLDNTTGRSVLEATIEQAIRQMRNTIEGHVASVAYQGASRAFGTAGTAPFSSDFGILADLRQILEDNGSPVDDGQLSLVLSSAAATKLRQVGGLYKVNESGTDTLLRRGELLSLMGLSIKTSAQARSHTKGTGAGYLANGAAAAGSRAIAVDTGTGTMIAGDVITFAGDANKYVVGGSLSGSVVPLNHPGLRASVADNAAITVGNNYTANVAFHRRAIELVMRAPIMPDGGDAGGDSLIIQDTATGLVFRVSIYRGYLMNSLEITTYYQAKVWQPEFVATLIG